jgi:hypothetical protein
MVGGTVGRLDGMVWRQQGGGGMVARTWVRESVCRVGLGPFKPGWRVAPGHFNSGIGLHYSTQAGPLKPFQLPEDFSNNQKIPNSKIQNLAIPMSKNIHILHGDRLIQNGQLSLLAQLPIPSGF